MLKENWRFVARIQRVGDLFITAAVFVAAYYGRTSLLFWNDVFSLNLPFEGPSLAPLRDYALVLSIALASTALFLQWRGAYSSMRFRSKWQLFYMFIECALFVFFMLAGCLFLLKLDVSRSFLGLFCVLQSLSLTIQRYVVLSFLRHWRRRGYNFRNIILCGFGDQAIQISREIVARPELGIRVRGFADLRDREVLQQSSYIDIFRNDLRESGCSSIGRFMYGTKELSKALKEYAIDEIIFTNFTDVMPEVEDMIALCAEQGVRTTLAANMFSVGIIKSGMSYFGDIPLIHFQTPPGDRWELGVKRILDMAISLIGLMLFLPVFVVVAILVKTTSKGPILFSQRRIGLNGRSFRLYKFRSMYVDAEEQLDALRAYNEMEGPVFKMKNDPRITPVGRILRRFSLDELPQLWNVFVGDMSLVGPRPPVPGEVLAYRRKFRRRLSMRPGITCTWQVSGRNNIRDFESWVKLDLEYIDNWSLARDLKLLLQTIPAVLMGTGAR
ncbi:MAG: sugar transferase [Bdellovibrionales bacterium]|nr:sugar transferase [Bdellovibrionales bacterium]